MKYSIEYVPNTLIEGSARQWTFRITRQDGVWREFVIEMETQLSDIGLRARAVKQAMDRLPKADSAIIIAETMLESPCGAITELAYRGTISRLLDALKAQQVDPEVRARLHKLGCDLARYADEYSEALTWGGPTIYPQHPIDEKRAAEASRDLGRLF